MRTPVATLKGYMEGLLDGVFDPDPETQASSLGEINRLKRLAGDLSTLSRAEEGRVDLHLESIGLAALVTEVADRLRPQFDDKEVKLKVQPGPVLPVMADRDRTTQILTNLIGNALAYTPSGGRVWTRCKLRGKSAQIEIADTARGLTAEQAALVFERFYRADRSSGTGTGIGLTIARTLARAQGGDISVSSPGLEQGSTFVLEFPVDTTSNAHNP